MSEVMAIEGRRMLSEHSRSQTCKADAQVSALPAAGRHRGRATCSTASQGWGAARRARPRVRTRRQMAIELDFDTMTQDRWEVLSVRGEIDAYTSPRLR